MIDKLIHINSKCNLIFLSGFTASKELRYERVKMFHVFAYEGKGVDNKFGISLSHCQKLCTNTLGCKSFAYCSKSGGKNIHKNEGRCHLKDLEGSKNQAIIESIDCTSYFKQHNLNKSKYKS